MTKIILSLRGKYFAGIISGLKDWEIRKTYPKRRGVFEAYVYESKFGGGLGMVVGRIEFDFILPAYSPLELNDKKTMLDLSKLYDYANGKTLYAWHISKAEKFKKPLPLSEFGLERAPQNWQYIKGENDDKANKKANK
ncbi:MAG TPA: hypothetical protein PKI60_07290 [Oscillospiraceae bacterium]|nr:hypothetical protein [Oscillospiraceae bacterium]